MSVPCFIHATWPSSRRGAENVHAGGKPAGEDRRRAARPLQHTLDEVAMLEGPGRQFVAGLDASDRCGQRQRRPHGASGAAKESPGDSSGPVFPPGGRGAEIAVHCAAMPRCLGGRRHGSPALATGENPRYSRTSTRDCGLSGAWLRARRGRLSIRWLRVRVPSPSLMSNDAGRCCEAPAPVVSRGCVPSCRRSDGPTTYALVQRSGPSQPCILQQNLGTRWSATCIMYKRL